MDTVMIASNMRQMTRLQLLIEVVQRVWRILTEEDRARYAALFEAFLEGTAGQYCYRVRGEDLSGHLAAVGQLMYRLVTQLDPGYAEDSVYQMLHRVFGEHFAVEEIEGSGETTVRTKMGDELSANSLQSPDDWEATFREKRGKGYRGYTSNLTEICDPENPVQLLTYVQVGSNLTDDEQMLVEALPGLKERTELDTLWSDGGFTGTEAEKVCRKHEVKHVPTSIRGDRPAADKLNFSAFDWEFDEEGNPTTVRCPGGQQVAVRRKNKPNRFLADFDEKLCEQCPWKDQCPAKLLKKRPVRTLSLIHI